MSILLYVPGLAVILFKRKGLLSTLRHLMTITAVQTVLAKPFLAFDPWAYLNAAFDLKRIFLYKWTVNWRMVDEEAFLSRKWALGLLAGHVLVLALFGLFRWCRVDGGVWSVLARGLKRPTHPAAAAPITADYIATVLFTSNLIGIIFARSLHYQFYSWYAHQIPFLAWKSPYPVVISFCTSRLAILLGIEYAWNVFPSTPLSSSILLSANSLLLVGAWLSKDKVDTKMKAS
ncbi:hypothetical protein C0991_004365 [Blastosporella zonata]|nr:hypothetical protein C0991_004365 [Blastosporella zonata]